MNTPVDQVPAASATSFLQRFGEAQLAWQQLCWRLTVAPWNGAWLRRPVIHAVAVKPIAPAGHELLEVPPAVAADGEHALFA